MSSKKYLILCDFEKTITKTLSYDIILTLFENDDISKQLKNKYKDFLDYSEALFHKLKEENITFEKIKVAIENGGLNEKMSEFVKFIEYKKDIFETAVLSANTDILIKCVLDHNNIKFDNIYSHKGNIEDNYLIFSRENSLHEVNCCQFRLCKGIVLSKILEKNNFEKVFFIGDGLNDYCAARYLRKGDVLFPRKDFDLHNKLLKDESYKNEVFDVCVWENGEDLINYFNNII